MGYSISCLPDRIVLMPPKSPNSQYDFIFNGGQPKKQRFNLSGLSGPVKIIIAAVILMVVIIILGVSLGGKKNKSTDSFTTVLEQAQEINRINALEASQINDPDTLAVLTTSTSTLTSQQTQIKAALDHQKIKINVKALAAYQNTATDAMLQTAAQNNNLQSAYLTYLRDALNVYNNSLQTAFSSTSSLELKAALQTAYKSNGTLLSAYPLKQ